MQNFVQLWLFSPNYYKYTEDNTWVRGSTRFISGVEHEKYHVQHEKLIWYFQAPMYFSVYYINYRFSTNIKCPEAMIGDCLKSDNFHM